MTSGLALSAGLALATDPVVKQVDVSDSIPLHSTDPISLSSNSTSSHPPCPTHAVDVPSLEELGKILGKVPSFVGEEPPIKNMRNFSLSAKGSC